MKFFKKSLKEMKKNCRDDLETIAQSDYFPGKTGREKIWCWRFQTSPPFVRTMINKFCCKITNSWFYLGLFFHVYMKNILKVWTKSQNQNFNICTSMYMRFTFWCNRQTTQPIYLYSSINLLPSKTLPNAQQTQDIWVLWVVQHL